MIEVNDVTVSFGDVTALIDVDLTIDDREFVTVVGPSGCGKTTLLRTIAGLREPTNGQIRLDGDPPNRARSEGNIGFVFQQHTLLPWKSALQNITFLRRMAGKTPDPDGARKLLSTMGLEDFENARPAALSGGMKQRVAIARTLHLQTDVLLMDEPFGELDEITRNEMGIEVREVWRREQKTILFVTHSVPEAVLLADQCVVMHDAPGRIAATFEIDLPRPRDESVFESLAYHEQVAAVRSALHEGDDDLR